MIVRCGRCRAELEVAGAGEFVCPACGTRNAVKGAPAASEPFGLPDLGGAAAPPPPDLSLTWIRCPECRRKFVVGEGVLEVACPACAHQIDVTSAEPANP